MKKMFQKNQIFITALALLIAVAGYLNFMGKKVKEDDLFTASAQFEESTDDLTAEADVAETGDVALVSQEEGTYDALTDIDSMDSEEEMVYSDYLQENEQGLTALTGENGASIMAEDTDTAALYSGENGLSASTDGDASLETGEETAENPEIQEADKTALAEGNTESAKLTEDYDGQIPGEAVFTSAVSVTSIENANLLKEQTRQRNKEMLLGIIESESISDAAKQDAINRMVQMTDLAQKECAAQILLEAKGFEDVVVSISNDQADVIVHATELSDAKRAQIEDIVSRKTGISVENVIISPVK